MSTGAWHVVVEEHVDRVWQGLRWEISRCFAAGDHQQALTLAHQTAVHHVPKFPKAPESRTLFRLPDGAWLVHVRGPAGVWHFRVSVAEHYGTYPGEPQA